MAEKELAPVPPYVTVTALPSHNPLAIVPTEVNEEETTFEASVVPDNVPAGATTTLVEAAVINPFAFTVKEGIAVEDPNEPVFEFTVANVKAALPGPAAVPSPVKAVMAAGAPVIAEYGIVVEAVAADDPLEYK